MSALHQPRIHRQKLQELSPLLIYTTAAAATTTTTTTTTTATTILIIIIVIIISITIIIIDCYHHCYYGPKLPTFASPASAARNSWRCSARSSRASRLQPQTTAFALRGPEKKQHICMLCSLFFLQFSFCCSNPLAVSNTK